MIDTKELRRLAQAALAVPDSLSAEWMDRLGQFQEAADASVVSELLDRLEAAEKERDAAELISLALRAKIEQMERQEPVAWIRGRDDHRRRKLSFEKPAKSSPDKFHWSPLYAIPGAQPSYLPSDLAEAIIADMQAQYDSELITENDSCEALIRLDGAIAAVEDNFAAATEAKP